MSIPQADTEREELAKKCDKTLEPLNPWDRHRIATLLRHPAAPVVEGLGNLEDWEIDLSAGRPILTYSKCSVIQDEQAAALIAFIQAALKGEK